MNLKSITLIVVFLIALPALAHEFWLEPQRYLFSYGDEINLRFKVGEQFTGENWKGNQTKIQKLKIYYSDIEDDLSNAVGSEPGDSLQFTMYEEGTAMVTFNSVNSFIELEASKFNEYLHEDGLTSAIEYRKEHQETDSIGREYYQRSVKTIVQVGAKRTDVCKKQTSLPLDLIPLSNPYGLNNKDTLRVKLLFNGKPLSNAKVRVWHKQSASVTDSSFTSNEKGEISFTVETTGEWMVSCVNMIRLTDDANANWQSYWGSVTWGYTGKAVKTDRAR
jgi:uncharacterized GH25 family protein